MELDYRQKYLKYKTKYLEMKYNHYGGNRNIYLSINPEYQQREIPVFQNQREIRSYTPTSTVFSKAIGSELFESIKKLACEQFHKDSKKYLISREQIENILCLDNQNSPYKDTILYYWYLNKFNQQELPEFVQLILKTKLVPSFMSKILSPELAIKLRQIIDTQILQITEITNFLTLIRNYFEQLGTQTVANTEPAPVGIWAKLTSTLHSWTVSPVKQYGYDTAKSSGRTIVTDIENLIKYIADLINPNMLHALDLIFFHKKYDASADLWDYISSLLEYLTCLFKTKMVDVKSAILAVLDWYSGSISFLVPQTILDKIASVKGVVNTLFNFENHKITISSYLNDLPIRFIFLDEILNIYGDSDRCKYLNPTYTGLNDDIITIFPSSSTSRILQDVIENYGPNLINNVYYIPPSAMLLLSIKLNHDGFIKPNNQFVTEIPAIPATSDYAPNIPHRSWNYKIHNFINTIYGKQCLHNEIKKLQKEIKDIKLITLNNKIKALFTFKRTDNVAINNDEQRDITALIAELSRLKLLDTKHNINIKNMVIKTLLSHLELHLDSINTKICTKSPFEFKDFNGILGMVKNTLLFAPFVHSKYAQNLIIKILTKYTAFIPLDITTFNILNLPPDKYKKFIIKYKFFEIYLQEKFGTGDYTNIFNPSDNVYEEIYSKWEEYKRTPNYREQLHI